MTPIVRCAVKHQAELSREWDEIANERHRQISTGEDLSYDHIIVPTALQLLECADRSVVLEVGSGIGAFTAKLARISTRVIAVEPSPVSVAVSRINCVAEKNVHFVEAYLEDTTISNDDVAVTSAVSVMSLMTAPNLRAIACTLSRLLKPKSMFVAILTHPWFWPQYWGYNNAHWFQYHVESFIEAPFSISKRQTEMKTTHIHRPLDQYFREFTAAGFRLDAFTEPMPSNEIETLYPTPWRFPRFLGLRWQRIG